MLSRSSTIDWRKPGFLPSVIAIGIMLVLSVYAYSLLPGDTQIPMQYGIDGQYQNYHSKGWALFSPPCICLILSLFMDVMPFIPSNGDESPMRRYAWYAVLTTLFGIHIHTVYLALSHRF